MMHIYSLRYRFLLGTVLTIIMLGSIAQPAQAQYDLGWTWDGSTMGVRNLLPQFGPSIAITLPGTVNWNTGITISSAPANLNTPHIGDVAYAPRSYGASNLAAIVQPFNTAGLACIDYLTGNLTPSCPTGTKISHAFIWVNTDNTALIAPSVQNANYLVVHEMGHVLGLGHGFCNIYGLRPTSVMAPNNYTPGCANPRQMFEDWSSGPVLQYMYNHTP